MPPTKRIAALALVLIAVIASANGVYGQSPAGPAVPLTQVRGEVIPNHYIVRIKPGVAPAAAAAASGGQVRYVYRSVLNGFAAELTAEQLSALQHNPQVAAIVPDQPVHATVRQDIDPTGDPWGIDRIDQRALPLSRTYTYEWDGSGVTAYIIDTGLSTSHPDFGGRAQNVYDAFGGTGEDCNGHGTHVAGTIGGTTYGVAKKVQLRGVRVLDCQGFGTWGGVISGLEWVSNNAQRPAVANMSLGGGFKQEVNDAVAALVASGVFVAVSAGNDAIDACLVSPASEPSAYTVAASSRNDQHAGFSNYGTCADIYAPGVSIRSDWPGGSTALLSGTSMASPHVAGCAALFKQSSGDVAPALIATWLTSSATQSAISGAPGGNTPNRLLYCYRPDVWIADTPVDSGLEPDPATATAQLWQSDALWIRHAADGIHQHQQPQPGQTNYVYARLQNRGQVVGSGTLHLYVSSGAAGLAWPASWSEVGNQAVSNLTPGATLDIGLPWTPAAAGRYRLLARWESPQEAMSYAEVADVNANARANNNIAWRDMNAVDLTASDPMTITLTLASSGSPTNADVAFQLGADQDGDQFLLHGAVSVDLGPALFDRWTQSGQQGSGISVISGTVVQVTDPLNAQLRQIALGAGEQFELKMIFKSNEPPAEGPGAALNPRHYHLVAQTYLGGSATPADTITYEIALPGWQVWIPTLDRG